VADGVLSLTADVYNRELTLKRVGSEIKLFSEYVFLQRRRGKFANRRKGRFVVKKVFTSPVCAVPPTVTNVDAIEFSFGTDYSDADLTVSLEGGPFAPGATPEPDGTSELELSVASVPGQTVTFVGGAEPDSFRFGLLTGLSGVNLNATEAHPDIDVTLPISVPQPGDNDDGEWPVSSARGGNGNDVITTAGGPEFDAAFRGGAVLFGNAGNDALTAVAPQSTLLDGGPGADQIVAGPRFNFVEAGSGADTVTGGSGRDEVDLGGGVDSAALGGGNDRITGTDRFKDTIDCGAGRDRAFRDPRDRLLGCERKSTEKTNFTFAFE
jgi:Ca2+-binding RTX toxin-like protein